MSDSDAADADGISDATARLRERLGRTEEDGNETETESEGEGEGDLADTANLVTRAEADFEDLLAILRGDREGTLEEAQEDLEDLIEVVDEAEDILSTVDLSALPEAVEWRSLPKAIEAGEIPDAIAKGDASEAVQFRKLLQIVNLRQVLDNVDLRSLWQEKDEFDDAIANATDEDGEVDDGSILDRFRDDGGDEENEDSSILDRFRGEDGETDDTSGSIGRGMMDGDGIGDEDGTKAEGGGIPSELIQAKVQSRLGDAIDEFRDSALDARDQLNEMRERSKEEFREKTGQTGQPTSRNPTAYSTLPSPPDDRADLGGVARFSTMSRTARHSSAPGRDHIYGDRFENRNREEDENNE